MNWQSHLEDVLYLNFAVNEDEVSRLLPPETTIDTRLHRGEPWGVFSLVLFRHDPIRLQSLSWPSMSYSQANLRVYVKDSEGTPAVYFKRLYIPGIQALLARYYAKQPVATMTLDFPTKVHEGGEYRWRLSGNGEGNIAGRIGRDTGVSGNLTSLFESKSSFVDYVRERPLAYYSAGMDYVYRMSATGEYGDYYPFQVKEWELGFLADDLERHNFPEAMTANFCSPGMKLEFNSPKKTDLGVLTRV